LKHNGFLLADALFGLLILSLAGMLLFAAIQSTNKKTMEMNIEKQWFYPE
jgi:hypothetical protein